MAMRGKIETAQKGLEIKCGIFEIVDRTTCQTITTNLLLQLHTNGIGLFEEDGIAPKQIPEGGELVETPLSESPQRQLRLMFCPRHWRPVQ